MDTGNLVAIIVGVCFSVIGYLLMRKDDQQQKTLVDQADEIKELNAAHNKLALKVAEEYVRHEAVDRILAKLEEIVTMLHSKADRRESER